LDWRQSLFCPPKCRSCKIAASIRKSSLKHAKKYLHSTTPCP
jgi:hypothetical protein